MFTRLQEAGTPSNTETAPTASTHASKRHLHQWLEDIGPPAHPPVTRNRRTWLPAIGLAIIISTTLLACGTSNTSERTVSEQTAPASTQMATQSMPPTAEKTSDTPSNGRSSSEATTQPEATPTKAAETQAPTPTPEPTTPPTDTPVPTPTPQPHHDFAQFLAPYSGETGDLVTRPTDDPSDKPVYPFNEIRLGGGQDLYYPAYTQFSVRGGTPLKYPGLTNDIQADIAVAISAAAAELIFEDNGPMPDQRIHTADHFRKDMNREIHKRMEWQLVEAAPEGITVRIFTTYISPDPVMWDREPTGAHYRITAEAFLSSVKTAESQDGNLYTLRDDHEYAPEFSHLVGEPVIERQ